MVPAVPNTVGVARRLDRALLALGGVALVWAFLPDAPLAAALRELADQAYAAASLSEQLGDVADLFFLGILVGLVIGLALAVVGPLPIQELRLWWSGDSKEPNEDE